MENKLVEVYVTYDPMEASLVRAKLTDEEIFFNVTGDYNISVSMETFNTQLGRIALKRPIKFFCKKKAMRKLQKSPSILINLLCWMKILNTDFENENKNFNNNPALHCSINIFLIGEE
ncbi:MAG: hypothetical protein IPI04_01230 [Ignavibacteria bacterium]|nr:hypothetical protein [Ignavibacteria bacterium]